MVFEFLRTSWVGTYHYNGRTLIAEGKTITEAARELGAMLNEAMGVTI